VVLLFGSHLVTPLWVSCVLCNFEAETSCSKTWNSSKH